MLLDSNIIIYASQPAHVRLREFIAANQTVVSAVSYVEALGYHRLKQADRDDLQRFFDTPPAPAGHWRRGGKAAQIGGVWGGRRSPEPSGSCRAGT